MKRPESTANGKTATQLQSPDEQKSTFSMNHFARFATRGQFIKEKRLKSLSAYKRDLHD